MPKLNQPAPDFELPNQDGEMVKLSDYRGKKVILFAFPKADTSGCNQQACGYRNVLPQIESANAVVLGISADSQEELKAWKSKKNLQYDLLSDRDHRILDEWDAWGHKLFGFIPLPLGKRSYWVIDENGIVIDMQLGVSPQGSVEQALATVNW